MRPGLWRSLSALVSLTAFAVVVAGSAQWDPCPMHGIAPHTPIAADQHRAGHDMPAAATHDHRDSSESHHAGHQCTCPGCCFGSNSIGLRTDTLVAPAATHVTETARIDFPAATIPLLRSPQLALPFAHAPPALGVTPQRAAQSTT
jgi:hypothetical protein